jgi:hypothetical protein
MVLSSWLAACRKIDTSHHFLTERIMEIVGFEWKSFSMRKNINPHFETPGGIARGIKTDC